MSNYAQAGHTVFYVALLLVVIGFILPRKYGYIRSLLVFFGLTFAFGFLGFILALFITPFMNMRVIRFDRSFYENTEDQDGYYSEQNVYDEPIYYEETTGFEEDYSTDYETEKAHRLLDTDMEIVEAEFEEVDE